MITYLVDLKNVAFYEVALSTSSVLGLLFTPILSLVFPLTTKLIEENKMRLYFQMITRF